MSHTGFNRVTRDCGKGRGEWKSCGERKKDKIRIGWKGLDQLMFHIGLIFKTAEVVIKVQRIILLRIK